MLFLSFLFGMVGGWMVNGLVEYRRGGNARTASFKSGSAIGGTHRRSNRPLSKSPEWEDIRKIPGQIFWTMVVPLFVMAVVSRDATDLAAWLIVMCMVMYAVLRFSFTVAGEFLPWGPEGSITTRKRMIKAAELYMKAKYSEIPKEESLSLKIEETSKRPLEEAAVFRMFDSSDMEEGLCRHYVHYGRTREGMSQMNQETLAALRKSGESILLAQGDLSQIKEAYSAGDEKEKP